MTLASAGDGRSRRCGCLIASADARPNVPTPLPPCAGEPSGRRTADGDTAVGHGLARTGLAGWLGARRLQRLSPRQRCRAHRGCRAASITMATRSPCSRASAPVRAVRHALLERRPWRLAQAAGATRRPCPVPTPNCAGPTSRSRAAARRAACTRSTTTTEKPGPVVFETEIREAGPDGFVTVMRNTTAMRLMGLSIADPGDISSMLSIQRVGARRVRLLLR